MRGEDSDIGGVVTVGESNILDRFIAACNTDGAGRRGQRHGAPFEGGRSVEDCRFGLGEELAPGTLAPRLKELVFHRRPVWAAGSAIGSPAMAMRGAALFDAKRVACLIGQSA
ncbi:protein of unknown function [Thauera humireducens]|nr:protein of unknown function [Thauera humireducens]